MRPVAALVGFGSLFGLWEGAVRLFALPPYILPSPSAVAATLWVRWPVLWPDALVTMAEIVLGLAAGVAAGVVAALAMAASPLLRAAIGPVLPVSQAIPVFAIGPVLVIWFGFGLGTKVVMAGLIIFFPVAAAFFDGLRRTDAGLVDLARLWGAGSWRTLALLRVPAALPQLGSGLKVAAALAPIGAVVGEWIGSAAGLGHLMLYANARAQTDLVFAALAILVAFALVLWLAVDAAIGRLLHWAPETLTR